MHCSFTFFLIPTSIRDLINSYWLTWAPIFFSQTQVFVHFPMGRIKLPLAFNLLNKSGRDLDFYWKFLIRGGKLKLVDKNSALDTEYLEQYLRSCPH